MGNDKNYSIKEITPKSKNPSIVMNVIFIVSGLVLAGVAFGIGDELFKNSTIKTIAAFGGVITSSTNIKIMRDKLKLKTPKEKVKEKK